MMENDDLLLRAAYDALVENCVYQQSSATHRQGINTISRLVDRLGIEPTDGVRDAIAEVKEI